MTMVVDFAEVEIRRAGVLEEHSGIMSSFRFVKRAHQWRLAEYGCRWKNVCW